MPTGRRSVGHLPSSNLIIRPIIFLVLISHRWRSFVSGEVFERCDFVNVLIENQIPFDMLAHWTCLATHVSGLNSSQFIEREPDSPDPFAYGIFAINNTDCATDDGIGICGGIRCEDLLDGELEDDIKCANRVRNYSGTFYGWPEYVAFCRNADLSVYTDGCIPKVPPAIDPPPGTYLFMLGDRDKFINCKSKSVYEQSMDWVYDAEEYPAATISVDAGTVPDTISSRLIFPVIDFNTTSFICIAWNEFGRSQEEIQVTVIIPTDETTTLLLPANNPDRIAPRYEAIFPVAVVGVAVIVSLSLVLYRKYLFKVYGLTDEEIRQFEHGVPSKLLKLFGANSDADLSKQPFHYLPYDKRFEIENGKLKIRNDEVLGRGHFGIVFKGDFQGEIVAVKTPKGSTETGLSNMKALLTELKIMIHIGEHPNIVNLIGAQTGGLRHAQLYIAVEYCEFGDLENYLRHHKLFYVDPTLPTCYISGGILTSEAEEGDPITFLDLLTWSTQIASGMAHLEQKKVIHGDLACRNVLLCNKRNAKVSDFGLSRDLYSHLDYVKCEEQCVLPWRWMAIETLTAFSFGSKSDAWSFGVTLWEIFSLGDVPYPGLSWSQEFPRLLKGGMRLLKPDHATQQIYDVMMSCWDLDPSQRPAFSSLQDTLVRIKNDVECPSWRINMEEEEGGELGYVDTDSDSGNGSIPQ